mgnify:CR=1 FL=1
MSRKTRLLWRTQRAWERRTSVRHVFCLGTPTFKLAYLEKQGSHGGHRGHGEPGNAKKPKPDRLKSRRSGGAQKAFPVCHSSTFVWRSFLLLPPNSLLLNSILLLIPTPKEIVDTSHSVAVALLVERSHGGHPIGNQGGYPSERRASTQTQ